MVESKVIVSLTSLLQYAKIISLAVLYCYFQSYRLTEYPTVNYDLPFLTTPQHKSFYFFIPVLHHLTTTLFHPFHWQILQQCITQFSISYNLNSLKRNVLRFSSFGGGSIFSFFYWGQIWRFFFYLTKLSIVLMGWMVRVMGVCLGNLVRLFKSYEMNYGVVEVVKWSTLRCLVTWRECKMNWQRGFTRVEWML